MEDTQNNIESDIEKPVQIKTVLSKEQFKEFYTFLNIIKNHFNDLGVVNGKFRARSNDKTCIVETEFSYFKGAVFSITDIKMLVKMLYALNKKTAITIVIDDMNVFFADGYQSVQVINANPGFIDNKFMTDEEMKKILDDNADVEKLLIKETLPKSVVCNIHKITRDFHKESVEVHHMRDDLKKGYFYISDRMGYGHAPNDNSREYTIKLKEPFLMSMKRDHFFNISSIPFIFNRADMALNYYLNKDESIVMTINNTKVDGLKIYVLTRAAYLEETEE